ncbi:hypothetical protein AURDEDRAFT_174592 [Auricularia subglabra TFB-10046 SS5]|uniref:F-box domain-containing protein n=1 Tax=Auricularia subglabra (strain TFB-10046 / SS5) TaxID=717982 RepID=J0LFW5_AURST|nr:hypothetical protein AURDEDRAFT_174592 [Auricularia subglabra TFB-10046 SS5]
MATILKLPNELMAHVFSLLPFSSLTTAGWICRHWRRLSRNHPSFWADIRIDCLSPASLFWACQRFIWTYKRQFCLVVDFQERHVQVEKALLGLVCDAMGTVHELHINLDSFYAISIFETLLNRAEHLERFSLGLVLGPKGELFALQDLPLPSGIFRRSTDRLKSVSLCNVLLTHITPIPAFTNVTFVSIAFEECVRYEFPTYLYDYFPQMVGLALSSGSIIFLTEKALIALVADFSRLSYLDGSFSGRCTLDVFRYMDTAKIAEDSVTNPNDDAVYANLSPLRSPFHMFIQNRRSMGCQEIRISIWSESTNHTRHFAENYDNYKPGDDNGPLSLFENEDFAQQISSLTIDTLVWPVIMPFFPPNLFIYHYCTTCFWRR